MYINVYVNYYVNYHSNQREHLKFSFEEFTKKLDCLHYLLPIKKKFRKR